MRFYIYFFFLFLCISASGQEGIRLKQGADTTAINHLIKVAGKLPPDSAIVLYDSALKMSIAANYDDGAFTALMTKGIKYLEKQEYEQSRICYTAALQYAAGSPKKGAVAWVYNNIGSAYSSEGDYLRASENFYTALKELKKRTTEPTPVGVNIYNNLAEINTRLNQPGKAMEYINAAEDMARKGNLYFQLAEALTNKGEYYNSIHNPDSARKCFLEVMDIGKKIDKTDLQAIANSELGKTEIETRGYEKAISYLEQAISLSKNRFPYIAMDASYALGDAWYHLGKYKQAETILISALQETKAHNIKDRYIDVYTKLAAVYKAEGKYKDALDCMDSLLVIKDTLTSIEKATAYNQLEIKYKTSEKDKQIVQNQLLIAQQKSKITRKNIWMAAIAGCIFLLGLTLIGIYRNTRHKESLQAEQIKSLQQQNKIGTLRAVVQGEENERGRIARELHDGIGGMLAAAMMRFRTIRHDNEEITKTTAYNEAMGMLDQMGDEIRKTAHNLMPEVLEKQDLAEAVQSFCINIQEEGVIKIDFQSYGSFDNISQEVKLNIYRILQELLKNIKQHSHATNALVQLMMNEQTLAITVEDNGTGFDTEEKNNGIGLHNIETRVRSLAGNYSIESEAGKGTTVYIEFDTQQLGINKTL